MGIVSYLGSVRRDNQRNLLGIILNKIAWFYDGWNNYRRITSYRRNLGLSGDEAAKAYALAVEYVHLAGVKGDIAEFGTQTGRSARLLAKAIRRYREWDKVYTPKNLLLFDSFEGLPEATSEPDKAHPYILAGGWQPGSMVGLSPSELVKLVTSTGLPLERIRVFKGWFKYEVIKLPNDTKLSLLHIDGDLYQSAVDVLNTCFIRGFISHGAVVLFDDWNMAWASPEYGERKAWAEMVERYHVKYSDEGAYSWNAHKFIIHDYERGRR